ncbi:hypothetical protein Lser_V15G00235 [Lactuca serriola]
MRTGTNNSLFRTGLLLYVSTRGLSPQQAQAHENSKAFTLVTLHTNRTASNSSRKIRRWCSPQQKFTTQRVASRRVNMILAIKNRSSVESFEDFVGFELTIEIYNEIISKSTTNISKRIVGLLILG